MSRKIRLSTLAALVVAAALAPDVTLAQTNGASGKSSFGPGYTDIGPTLGLGGTGEAGLALGGRFEHAFKRLPDFGNGTIGIQASLDYWNYDNRFSNVDYGFRYINLGVTANYHFDVKSNPKLDPFVGLGLGNASVSTDYAGDYSSGVYFIGRAGLRYFMKPRLALYGDVGAGASTLNLGVTFGLGGTK